MGQMTGNCRQGKRHLYTIALSSTEQAGWMADAGAAGSSSSPPTISAERMLAKNSWTDTIRCYETGELAASCPPLGDRDLVSANQQQITHIPAPHG
ncbi:hypothetical protein XELAEV_18045187mg [Xenopus laevis]|uniref:Uncharacterized protein n=1 Tax=Xenopus laevis TaxID=8355 RepID=A0A974H4H0_XENLA|nr:hypothetical protein XELAEV_18045187mg [Xenopus laevis]